MKLSTKKPLVIENPSQKLLDFVRDLERRKSQIKDEVLAKKNNYFPAKKEQ
ncbi:hypothetical protein [Bacteroides reticulotermitis]|uniref:hypothetical protein n=1 Tax=Bacteroides reticulotermitis TaxID=1133319 RepID=UPI003A8958AA